MRIASILQSSAFIGVSFTLFVSCLTFQIYALLSYTETHVSLLIRLISVICALSQKLLVTK